MKRIFVYLLALIISCNVNAQKKSTSTLVGLNIGMSNPKVNSNSKLPKYKIGLPSFSYTSSIEKRLVIQNKLSFSLQYSLNYFSFNQRSLNSSLYNKTKIVSNSIGINSNINVTKRTSIVAGMGLNKSIYQENMNYLKSESPNAILSKTEKKFTIQDFNNFNPYFIIGIENGIQIFNKNLFYSLQYNFGFNPNKFKLIPTDNNNNENSFGGFRIGLKYKY